MILFSNRRLVLSACSLHFSFSPAQLNSWLSRGGARLSSARSQLASAREVCSSFPEAADRHLGLASCWSRLVLAACTTCCLAIAKLRCKRASCVGSLQQLGATGPPFVRVAAPREASRRQEVEMWQMLRRVGQRQAASAWGASFDRPGER